MDFGVGVGVGGGGWLRGRGSTYFWSILPHTSVLLRAVNTLISCHAD